MKDLKFRSVSVSLCVILLAGVLAGLVGCANNQAAPTASGNAPASGANSSTPSAVSQSPAATTRSVTDMMGKTANIPINLQRVAVLTSPQTIEMYIIGEQAKLCAISNAVKQWNFLGQIDPRVKTLPAVRAQAAQINIEALLQSNPDICIGSDMDMQVVNKNTSIPTLSVDTNSTSNYLAAQVNEVKFFGTIFNKKDRADKYVAYLENNLASIKKALSDVPANKRLKVFMGYNPDHLTTFGGDTFMNEWIQASGCVNAAQPITSLGGREGGLATISMEQILNWNPDIIVIDNGKPQDLYNDSTWSKLAAVQNKKVYVLPVGMFIWSRTSSEAAAMLPIWLALTAYQDKFPGDNMDKQLKKFYADIINYNLTDEQVKSILNP